jgi:hypothetical protein
MNNSDLLILRQQNIEKVYQDISQKERIVLFLDFDDVLNSDFEKSVKYNLDGRNFTAPFQPNLTSNFNSFFGSIKEKTDIVICSTWRYGSSDVLKEDKDYYKIHKNGSISQNEKRSFEFIQKLLQQFDYFEHKESVIGVTPILQSKFSGNYNIKRDEIQFYINHRINKEDIEKTLFIILDDQPEIIPTVPDASFLHIKPGQADNDSGFGREGSAMGFHRQLAESSLSLLQLDWNGYNQHEELQYRKLTVKDEDVIAYLFPPSQK